MPRKIIYSDQFPYNITARANNKEWFAIEQKLLWTIFESALLRANIDYQLQIHAFELMSNHYHLVASVGPNYSLGRIMHWLQLHITKRINWYSGRIDHVFGDAYKATQITRPEYYYHAIKYLYRNSVKAGLAARVEAYEYSTLRQTSIPLSNPISGLTALMPSQNSTQFLEWLNTPYGEPESDLIAKALRRTQFKFPARIPKETLKKLWHS